MRKRVFFKQISQFIVGSCLLLLAGHSQAAVSDAYSKGVKSCLQNGWKHLSVKVGGLERAVLWKRPRSKWKHGAIVVLHGGGGSHHQFCAGGSRLEAQIDFAEDAVEEGFAVFLLDSTKDSVTDEKGQRCGKRFDFTVLERPNLDLPFIGKMIKRVIPQLRPGRSAKKIFITGFSSGGYMAVRAATHFNKMITAFAPVAAGDPYGTRTRCDVSLSKNRIAKGILIDIETNKVITEKNACQSDSFPNEKPSPTMRGNAIPVFKQFHHKGDAIIDYSCMKKAQTLLRQQGYIDDGAYLMGSSKRRVVNHLWQDDYNDEMIDFFKSQ